MIWAAAVLVALLGLVAVLNAIFPGVLGGDDSRIRLTQNIVLLVLIGSSVILGYRGRAKNAVKHALAWAGIALVVLIAYSYRQDFRSIGERFIGELIPSRPIMTASGHIELRQSDDGHFHADAWINGVKVRLLVDTGASSITLSPSDARRVGIDPDALDYGFAVATANGPASVARITLDEVDLGGIRFRQIAASVHRDGLDQSLLGMNVLDRLTAFERRGDRLILRP